MPVALKSSEGKWIMSSTILASSMAFIDSTALNVVLPSLQKSLNATAADLFWILNAYLLILASLILVGGSMGDKLGRKKIFMLGIFIFIVASTACGFSPNVNFLIAFRIIQGVGGSLMIPGSLSIISSSINDNEKGKAIGTWSAFTTLVTMGGPVLGGALADAGLWRYIFFINVPIGIVALLILAFRLEETVDEHKDHHLDFTGAVSIALSLAAITFGFLRIPTLGLRNWQVVSSLIVGVTLLLVFIVVEKKSEHPMMPLQLFANKTFTGTNLLTFFLYAGLGAGMLFLSLNLVQAQGYSQLQSGITFLPFTILMITITRLAGSIADKLGPKIFLIGGPTVAGLGLLTLSFVKQTHGASDYWTTFFPGILIFGFGMSLTVSPLTATVMGAADNRLAGTASGINNAVTRIANVFANAVFGALAVLLFSSSLQKEIKNLKIDDRTKQEIIAQTVNLGNAHMPSAINENDKQLIEKKYREGFINSYQTIMRICAGLAFSGALMALLFVKNEHIKKSNT